MTQQLHRPLNWQPHIRQHIDGPYIEFRDGTVHWLTAKERFALVLGFTSAAKLEAKHRPELADAL